MGVLLVPLERRVAGLGPAPRVVGVAVGPADVVDPGDGLVGRLDQEVEVLHLVHDSERPALLAGPVVREQDHQGVVQLAELLQPVDQPADLGVGVFEEGGERLLQAGGQPTLVVGQGVPRLDARVARREIGVGGEEPHLELAGEPPVAGHVPPVVEPPPVLLEIGGRRLVGRVHGAEGQVGEERPVGADGRGVVDEAQGVVDQILAQVVPLGGSARRLDAVVVVDQLGIELVGLALEEPVVPVEPALARPLVVGAGGRRVLHAAQVPLAEGEGGVALLSEHLGHGGGVVGDVAPHVGVAAVEVGEGPHPDGVVVPAGEQRRPGRGAQGGDVEVRVAQTSRGQTVDVRRGELGSVAAEVGEAGVVEQDDHDVRCRVARMRGGGPPRCGLRLGAVDHPFELVGGSARTRWRHRA